MMTSNIRKTHEFKSCPNIINKRFGLDLQLEVIEMLIKETL